MFNLLSKTKYEELPPRLLRGVELKIYVFLS